MKTTGILDCNVFNFVVVMELLMAGSDADVNEVISDACMVPVYGTHVRTCVAIGFIIRGGTVSCITTCSNQWTLKSTGNEIVFHSIVSI